ncbi:MAG: hypothetical protein ABFD25_01165 [Clostridiaceae bacterium]
MAINEKNLLKLCGKENTRATYSKASGLEFHYTKKLLSGYIKMA